MMTKWVSMIVVVFFLSACQIEPVRDEQSPHSRLLVGSSIILHQSLPIPAGHSRVFLQFGRVVEKVRLERYQPHCNFEVREVSRGEAIIQPDTFTVTRVVEDEEEVVLAPAPLRKVGLLYSGDDMGTVMVTRLVRYTLDSASQSQVMRLTCHGGFDEPWRVKMPSVSEIRRALGEVATVGVAGAI